jgi:hypothetical protein
MGVGGPAGFLSFAEAVQGSRAPVNSRAVSMGVLITLPIVIDAPKFDKQILAHRSRPASHGVAWRTSM